MEHHQLAGNGRSGTRPARRILVCCALALAFFLLAARLDLAERVSYALGRHEHWQLDELALLLDVHLLDKSIYELGYELNNRPSWVRIPLDGISQLLRDSD